jgi:hypothetical protein
MDQKKMIALFKQQTLKQGVHLMTMASSSNSELYKGYFFKVICNKFQAHNGSSNYKSDWASQQSTMPSSLQLYNPSIKTGSLQSNKTTRGLAGKKNANEV